MIMNKNNHKKGVLPKLREAFQQLGMEMKRNGSFYELEYKKVFMFLSIYEDEWTFAIFTYVIDSTGNLDGQMLSTAIDVVEGIYDCYSGGWNDGVPYFSSPEFNVGEGVEVTAEWLGRQLKEFWDAYMFLQVNLHMLGDRTIFCESVSEEETK